jgi:NAD(P)-dependent dehydrogenase (short-subunit alcohol dehydrogenase family)
MLLEGKRTIVTGSGSADGIGFAVARLFAEHGARVALLDIDGDAVKERARVLGGDHLARRTDVTDAEDCRIGADAAAEAFGGIDILVNNAGIVYGTPVMDVTSAEYDEVLGVNLKGTFQMAQAVIPHMRRSGAGNIVCMSSIAGQSGGGVFGRSHYAAAKAGIMGLAKGLARELAADGIRVNAVAPGPIDNDFTKGRMTREIKDRIAETIPLGRLGRSDEVAGVCLFLASELSSFVTGAVIDANGGLLIH